MKWRHVIAMVAVPLPATEKARNALGMSSGSTLHFSVCACIYRRPEGPRALLQGLGAKEFAETRRPDLKVIIVDNEGCATAKEICQEFERRSSIPVDYFHEQRRRIPQARNTCLNHIAPTCDYFAFIDDDEIPDPDWLEQLLLAQGRTGADVVRVPLSRFFPTIPRHGSRTAIFSVGRAAILPPAHRNGRMVNNSARPRPTTCSFAGLRFASPACASMRAWHSPADRTRCFFGRWFVPALASFARPTPRSGRRFPPNGPPCCIYFEPTVG
jgi:glycosyltransferase involved in cell wall biosynthesis